MDDSFPITKKRCSWTESKNAQKQELLSQYHDQEWNQEGPHSNLEHFQSLCLEIFQTGISWYVVLKRRELIKENMDNLSFEELACLTDAKMLEKAKAPGVIAHPQKLIAIRDNARAFLRLQEEFQSFETFLSSFVKKDKNQEPEKALKEQKLLLSSLKERGFKWIGPSVLTMHLCATGFLLGHETSCDFHPLKASP